MDVMKRAVPVAYAADPLEEVLQGIRDELARQNQLAAAGDRGAEGRAARLQQQLDNMYGGGGYAGRYGGSRFAGPGASRDVLDVLANGGSIQDPLGWRTGPEGRMVPRTSDRRGGGSLAGLMQKALAVATPSAGGYLVPEEVADEVLERVRARAVVYRAGARVVPVRKQLAINALSTSASAQYVAENAQTPVSEPTFSQDILLVPRDLAALVPVSLRMLRDTDNPAIEDVVRRDLARVLALRADLAFLRGAGTSSEPLGIRNTAGLTPAPNLGANGATPTYDNLMDTVAALRNMGAPFDRPAWVFHPRLLSTLEKLKDSQGRYLMDAGLLTYAPTGATGTLLGFPFFTTVQIPVNITTGTSADTTEVYFSSDWSECWVGEEDTLRIEVSGEASYWDGTQWVSAFQNRQALFHATMTHDVGLRQPELFTVLTGVRP